MKSDSGTNKPDSEANYSETNDSSIRNKWESTCMRHVLIQPSADTSTLQPYLTHACTVLSTYKTNLPRPLEHTIMFTRRQFNIATSSLANTCVFLLTNKANLPPLWTTMSLFPPEQLKIPTPSGKHMHSLVNKENKLAAPLNNRFLYLQNTSKLQPPLANTCVFLLTKKTNFPPLWKNMLLCPPEQFKIATPSRKYMHILAN